MHIRKGSPVSVAGILFVCALVCLEGVDSRLGVKNQEQLKSEAQQPAQAEIEQPKPQPIPFSHKLHSQFIPDCFGCHEMSEKGWEMTYPPEAKCMECHATIIAKSPAIFKLTTYYKERKQVPWVPVYRLPDDIYFSHKRHCAKAKVECGTCHGPVAEHDVIVKERATWMGFCVDCHKEKKARATWRSCHNR